MKKVITYGTFDLLHHGHINILLKAKALGDYLIVGVTTETYDKNRGKLNVQESLTERIENVRKTGLADEIIIEEYEGQKIDDIQKYGIDTFVIGSDWINTFDYLKEYCEVVYVERTRGISSTQLRDEKKHIIKLGIIGSGRIASRFIPESKYVSGLNVEGVFNPHIQSAKSFAEKNELKFYTDNLNEFIDKVNAVYIASPHSTHYTYITEMLKHDKHVLCEKPLVLKSSEAENLYSFAASQNLVLLEAIKTAYAPAFTHIISLLKSGIIGQIKDVDASFTKLISGNTRELDYSQAGGSMTELASYVLLPIIKLLGADYISLSFYLSMKDNIDLYTRGLIQYSNAIASFKIGLGVKTEGQLIISGTKGYLYVPAPWWKTEYFEVRYEDINKTKKYFYKFDDDGLRYELFEFTNMINNQIKTSYKLSPSESIAITKVIEEFRNQTNLHFI